MKKEIEKLLKDGGEFKVNNIAVLRRWFKSALNEDVDMLTLELKYVTGIKGGRTYDIQARTYDELVKEINSCVANYLADCAIQSAENFKNGYVG